MKRSILAAGLGLAAFALSACTTASVEDCEKAKLAVEWSRQVLAETCTQQSDACDAAGLALKVANISVSLVCPAGTVVP